MNKLIDMHCDTMLEAWRKDKPLKDIDLSINLDLLKANDCLAQFFAIFMSPIEQKNMTAWELFEKVHSYYEEQLKNYENIVAPVLCNGDIEQNSKSGKISSMLTIEDGVLLEGEIERLHKVYDMGVRLITLTWNFENSIGYPCSDDLKKNAMGLKDFGIDVVREMNNLGMLIDVSHGSEKLFFDVCKYSDKPFVASHSCAKSLCNHRRNLTDLQLKELGNKGGVVGVNFEKSFLRDDGEPATFDVIIKHLLYMKSKAGIDALGFGSDFDGIEDNGELINYSGFEKLLERMQNHFTDDEIDKISHENALRVINDVLPSK